MKSCYTKEDDLVIKANVKNMTHEEIGGILNRTRNSIRNRCYRLGFVDLSEIWTDQQINDLKEAYKCKFSEEIKLGELAKKLGKLKSNVCRKARQLGLTDISRELKREKKKRNKFESIEEANKANSKRLNDWIKENGHPRGMLGKNHTEKTKSIIAISSTKFNASLTEEQKGDNIFKAMKTREVNGTMQTMNRATASWGAGWREIGGVKKYYRSKWEANYARYLEWLKAQGEIDSWLHEPDTFWFDGIKRGCLSYLPDFKVTEKNGKVAYHEVKGWMDDRSKTKIKRMAKYHPNVVLIVIDTKAYNAIKKIMMPIIKEWETDARGR